MTSIRKFQVLFAASVAVCWLTPASAQSLAFQGFETDTGDFAVQSPGTTFRTPSGGGTLHLPASAGGFYAELHNIDDDFAPGFFGDSGFSYFNATPPFPYPPYPGAPFSQSVDMYVFANWPVALFSGPGIWIDMQPGHPSGFTSGEHNFRLTPTGAPVGAPGTSVGVFVDGQPTPIVNITTSGWYTFQMTWAKGTNPADLVVTNMNVYDHSQNLIGTTQVLSNAPGSTLTNATLGGTGYVWFTVWPNGWAGDVLGIDNVRADFLSGGAISGGGLFGDPSNLDKADSVINLTNTGFTGAFGISGNPGQTAGNICANVYVFDPQEELISCCSCLVTPNGLNSLSARGDLISNTLTPATPTSITEVIVPTTPLVDNPTPAGTADNYVACNPSAPTTNIAGGGANPPVVAPFSLLGWETDNHVNAQGGLSLTEVPFRRVDLGTQEFAQLQAFCRFNQINGTGFGVCKSCLNNGRGGARK